MVVGRLKAKVDSSFDGIDSDYIIAARNYIVPVDKDAAIESGIVDAKDAERLVDEIKLSLSGKSLLTRDHLMMLDLFANFGWKRPISFTQASLMKDYGIIDYARFDGYCYSFVPIYTKYRAGSEAGTLDADKLYPIYMGNDESVEPLYFGNIADEDVLVDYFYRFNLSAARIRENFARVASEYLRRGSEEDVLRAEALLDRGMEMLPLKKLGYSHSNTQPYIRGYYTIANYFLQRATEDLEVAVAELNDLLDIHVEIVNNGDNFTYFYDLSDAAAERQATAMHRGLDIDDINSRLLSSDETFARAEGAYRKGDMLAAEYVKQRGEWVNYYLQYATYDSFSFAVSDELYNKMLDIIETLNISHLLAGSFDWVANGETDEPLVENPLNFDKLVVDYLAAIKRLAPDDANDPAMALIEGHICNLYEIYNSLPAARFIGGKDAPAPYIYDTEEFLMSDAANEVLVIYGKI